MQTTEADDLMQFFSYWSKATATEFDRDGKELSASCWRGSDSSQDDAQRSALAQAYRVLQRLMRGEPLGVYPYGKRPLREEVLESQTDALGRPTIAVTRNAYGVLVLNTAHVMFIDIDLAPVALGAKLRQLFSRLLGGTALSPEEQQVAETKNRLEEHLRVHPDWGLRLYRTAAGLRVLVTHELFDPTAEATLQQMSTLGADPLYVRLCRDQECFRARLTPKPWRCAHTPNRVTWPHETEEERLRFEAWLVEYEQRQSRYAACHYLESLGSGSVPPEVEQVIAIHDADCRADRRLPLA